MNSKNSIISSLKSDLPASIVVFLVALPLCLGVALASGAPLLSGIISGIVGGIVVGLLSKSQTSVSGPAAGLAAVVLAAITQLGNFEVFLTAVLIAGMIQIIMGILRAGSIADFIPSNVIKGLLAAIGIILILKQIPHAIGYDADAQEDFTFSQADGENTFSELIKSIDFITPGAILISVLSILILVLWDKTPMKKIKFFPSSLFVVILGIVLSIVFKNYVPFLAIEPEHLVNIPKFDTENLSGYIHIPSAANFGNYQLWVVAFTIAMVASLETLLNLEAIDKLDPHKRESNPNRELVAQGVGNICSGFLGGIPITSVVVRSSVNIQSGNKTKLSAILHGIFMLLSVLALGSILNLIPLASLAAVLLTTGYKLAKVSLFKEMYRKGWDQFIPFVVTILAIIFTDLLIGVLVGLAVSILFLLVSNFKSPFVKEENKLHIGNVVKLVLQNQVSFFNKSAIKKSLWALPEDSKVVIDATYSKYIDQDVLEIIEDFRTAVAPDKNIQLNVLGLKEDYDIQDQIQFINVLDKETQQKLTPSEVLDLLKAGNERFITGKSTDKYFQHQVDATQIEQNPMAVIINCIDSRTSPEIIFDAGLGDILTIRIAGNIITPEIIGSIKIAVLKLGAKLIVVKGHSGCGAVSLAFKDVNDEKMSSVTNKIQKAIVECGYKINDPEPVSGTKMEEVIRKNVENSLKEILAESPLLSEMIRKKEVGIVGAYHDLSTSRVYFDEML